MIVCRFKNTEFNINFSVPNEIGKGIDFATILMWWNENNVSNDVQNIGNGEYFVSLESITIAIGDDPILLNFTITANGFEDKYFETYIAVDPITLQKDEGEPTEEFPLILIITIATISSGTIIGLVIIVWYRRKKRE